MVWVLSHDQTHSNLQAASVTVHTCLHKSHIDELPTVPHI
jgi:hypothetical protein